LSHPNSEIHPPSANSEVFTDLLALLIQEFWQSPGNYRRRHNWLAGRQEEVMPMWNRSRLRCLQAAMEPADSNEAACQTKVKGD